MSTTKDMSQHFEPDGSPRRLTTTEDTYRGDGNPQPVKSKPDERPRWKLEEGYPLACMTGESQPPDGGPAFPGAFTPFPLGMTLRQWYAGQALKCCGAVGEGADFRANIARECFAMADAMIAAESKQT